MISCSMLVFSSAKTCTATVGSGSVFSDEQPVNNTATPIARTPAPMTSASPDLAISYSSFLEGTTIRFVSFLEVSREGLQVRDRESIAGLSFVIRVTG